MSHKVKNVLLKKKNFEVRYVVGLDDVVDIRLSVNNVIIVYYEGGGATLFSGYIFDFYDPDIRISVAAEEVRDVNRVYCKYFPREYCSFGERLRHDHNDGSCSLYKKYWGD